MTILETKDLRKIYGSGDTEVRALDGINLAVENGEFVAVVGTSGSGKSTLLHMLGGLDRPSGGRVYLEGKSVFDLKDRQLAILRRQRIGFVFQAYNLLGEHTARENICIPLHLDGRKPDPDYFREVAERLGTAPERCWVFEDALNAVRSAKAAGMNVCAIEEETSRDDREAIAALADRYIKDYSEWM